METLHLTLCIDGFKNFTLQQRVIALTSALLIILNSDVPCVLCYICHLAGQESQSKQIF